MTVVCDSHSQKAKLPPCNKSQENILFVFVFTNSKKARIFGQYLRKKFGDAAEILADNLKSMDFLLLR